ncbi:hypothetical protein HYE15_03755 [Mycoplasmopsis bovis]|nr:hypothetical protein [Mycoplasmopsis bovis]QQH25664.1 hypothetical protein HYE15_03755 [Mycoplasmopsis bovis]
MQNKPGKVQEIINKVRNIINKVQELKNKVRNKLTTRWGNKPGQGKE